MPIFLVLFALFSASVAPTQERDLREAGELKLRYFLGPDFPKIVMGTGRAATVTMEIFLLEDGTVGRAHAIQGDQLFFGSAEKAIGASCSEKLT